MTTHHFFSRKVVALTLLCSWCSYSALIPTVEISDSFTRVNIKVISHEDPQFGNTFAALAGAVHAAELAWLAPYVLIVDTSRANFLVQEVLLNYERTNHAGRTLPGVIRFQPRQTEGASAKKLMLLGPNTQINQVLQSVRDGNNISPSEIAAAKAFVNSMIADEGRFRSLTVRIDSITLTSGQVLGEDRFGVVVESHSKLSALLDIEGLLTDTQVSDAELTQRLGFLAQQSADTGLQSNGTRDHKLAASVSLAKVLFQEMLRSQNRAALLEFVRGLKLRPDYNLKLFANQN